MTGPYSGVLVLAVLGISTLAGCSSGNDPSAAQGEGVGDAFAAKALSVCASAQESKDRWSAFPVSDFDPSEPESQNLPEVAVWLENEVAPTFNEWRDGLTALGTPPTGQKPWAEMLTAVTDIADLNASQVKAAQEQDADAFAQATEALGEVQPKLERATTEAGVAKCADVHAG